MIKFDKQRILSLESAVNGKELIEIVHKRAPDVVVKFTVGAVAELMGRLRPVGYKEEHSLRFNSQ
jgi:hypothetical protein